MHKCIHDKIKQVRLFNKNAQKMAQLQQRCPDQVVFVHVSNYVYDGNLKFQLADCGPNPDQPAS